jgi:hypothetical protein
VFIFFSSELAPDQYLLVGIFNGTSVIAFPLLSHVVTLPVTPIVDGLYGSACAGKPTTES